MKQKKKNSKTYGLTGSIASGKSTVARVFAENGWGHLDADQIARELRSPGSPIEQKIQQKFGTSDRKELRKIVFSDPAAKEELETILHPAIRAESEIRIKKLTRRFNRIIYEASLLVETNRHSEFDGLIVVETPLETQVQRLMRRDQVTEEEAKKMIHSQLSNEEKKKFATHLISNTGTLEDLTKLTKKLAFELSQ